MIPDTQTNHLHLADILPKKYPEFYHRFKTLLSYKNIDFALLPGTKDIWAVDYMPIQLTENSFAQFVYNPGYLQAKTGLKSISDVDGICNAIGIKTTKWDIVLDGGNVVRTADKVIMTGRIFSENPTIPERTLINRLLEIFEVDKLIFVPAHPKDFTGHADGMVRFLDDNTVLINDDLEAPDFQTNFRMALHNAGLEYIKIPYNPNGNIAYSQANGVYINYLQMKGIIVLPVFNIKEDEEAVKFFEHNFSNLAVETIECNEIAKQGGILNCITWNIKKIN